jgi:hypothetical protein
VKQRARKVGRVAGRGVQGVQSAPASGARISSLSDQ